MAEKATAPKKANRMKPKVETINETLLDITPEDFCRRLEASNVSARQLHKLTDITRNRIQRVCSGEKASLVERRPGYFVVPRSFAIILLAIETGLLLVGDESVKREH